MTKRLLLGAAVVAVLVLGPSAAAMAKPTPTSGVHFTQGGEPTCTVDANLLADCQAELAGLGSGDLVLSTSVGVGAQYQCQNPGGNLAPGQNTVLAPPVVNTETIPGEELDNGRQILSGSTTISPEPADTVSGRVAGCPNGRWTGVNPTITSATVNFSATQGGVTLFSCSGPVSASGGTPTLTCTGVAV
jgi:hypothetical protein